MYASWNARAVGLSLPAHETIEIAASTGFVGVDLLVRDIVETGVDVAGLRLRMDDLGLRGGAWPLPVDWRAGAERFREELRQLPRLAGAAAILGLSRTGTWVLPQVLPDGAAHDAAGDPFRRTLEFHRDRLGRIAAILNDHGIRIGLEVMGPAGAIIGNTDPFVRRYGDLIAAFRELHELHPNLGLLADAFHVFAAGDDPEIVFSWGPDAIVWVHVADSTNADRSRLKDRERDLPGTTRLIDCRCFLEQLRTAGYSGPVTAEPLEGCRSLEGLNPIDAARRTHAALESVWPALV